MNVEFTLIHISIKINDLREYIQFKLFKIYYMRDFHYVYN